MQEAVLALVQDHSTCSSFLTPFLPPSVELIFLPPSLELIFLLPSVELIAELNLSSVEGVGHDSISELGIDMGL